MTWNKTQTRKLGLVRYEVFKFIVRYAEEHNGATPGYLQIAREFQRSYSTVRGHVYELALEGLLRIEDRQIIVEDSEWTPPPTAEMLVNS